MTEDGLSAAIYLRISQDRENTRLGVDRQREDALLLCKNRGLEVVEIFEDNDISAAGGKVRPAFEAMLSALSEGQFTIIVAWNLDRLTRNRRETVRLVEEGQRHRATIALVKGNDLDMSSVAGRMTTDIIASVARAEIETKSERQSRAQEQRAHHGKPPKGVRPLGYALDGSVIEPEARAVRRIYESFASGTSLRAIAAALSGQSGKDIPKIQALPKHTRTLMQERNARRALDGLEPRPVPEDGPWSSSTVLGILRNPRYAGYSTYTPKEELAEGDRRRSWRSKIVRDTNGEPVRGLWDPLVELALWERVQDKLDDPSRATNRAGTDRRHLGAGLYLCGTCERPVKTHSSRYRCAGHVMRSRTQIDDFVLEVVRRRLARADLHDLLPTIDEPRLQEIKAQIETCRAKVRRAERDYDEEHIEARDLKRIRSRENTIIDSLQAEMLRLTSVGTTGTVLSAKDPVAAFAEADLANQRTTIDVLCEVRLFPHPRGRKAFDPDSVSIIWRS